MGLDKKIPAETNCFNWERIAIQLKNLFLELVSELVQDSFCGGASVNVYNFVSFPIKVNEGSSLLAIYYQAVRDCFYLVVVTGVQFSPASVAGIFFGRRQKGNVEVLATTLAHTAA